MTTTVQRVKYTVEVDTSQLDGFKVKLGEVNTAIGRLNSSFSQMKSVVDAGLLKSITSLNTRLSRTTIVGQSAQTSLAGIATPLQGMTTSLTQVSGMLAKLNTQLAPLSNITSQLTKLQTAQVGAGTAGKAAGEKSGYAWLKAFGIFQSAKYAVQQFWQAAKEGAQQLDMDRVLNKQFASFEATIRKAQELTSGTVSKGGLTKSYALMSSFGIPMDKFAENMELVQKTAIRTGQSAEFLSDSFARGISRLSPLILDNLGIQVSLGDANAEYAAEMGITTTEMTKQQKTAALLNQVLAKLRINTEGVSLSSNSTAASVNRAEAAFDDLLMAGKKVAGMSIQGFGMMGQSQQSDIVAYTEHMKALAYALPDEKQANDLNAFFEAMAKSADGADLLSSFDFIQVGGLKSGGGRGDIGEISKMLTESASALQRFGVLSQGAAEGSDHLTLAFNALSSSPWAKKFLLGDEDIASIGVFDLMERNLTAAKEEAQQLVDSMGDLVTEKDKERILSLATKAAQDATTKRMEDAVKWAKANGKNVEETVLLRTRETEIFEAQVDLWADLLAKAIESRQLSGIALAEMREKLKVSQDQVANAQELFDVRAGSRMAEVALNQVLEARQGIEKDLADAQKALFEAQDDSARVEASRAIIAANNRIMESEGYRQAAQAAMLADQDILASYQEMSKAKLEEMKVFLQAQISMLHFGADPILKERNAIMIAEMENTIEAIQKLIDKPTRGRGRGSSKAKSVVEEFLGDPVEIKKMYALDAGGNVRNIADMIRQAYRTVQSLNIPGETKGGFLGTSNFFGTLDPDEFANGQEMVKQIKEMTKDLSAAGLNDIFSETDANSLDLFLSRMQQLEDHFDTLDRWAQGLDQVTVAMSTFHDGMDGLFGSDIISFVGDFQAGIEGMTEALKANAGAYGLVNAAMPVVRSFTKNLIKDRKAQAVVEALMQGAAAWAAYASGNIPGGIMHTTAATMYGLVAGGVLNLPKGKSKEDKPTNDAAKYTQSKMRDLHLHIDGNPYMTEAERGAAIRDLVREAERAGL